MSGFWMSISAVQKSAAGKRPGSRHYVSQILAGIALALLIGAVLFIAAAFYS
jgi:succinate dehydrogenase hydrophobic anchor subunit